MKSKFKITVVAGMLVTAFSAGAVQRDITVTADIDTTVDVTLADGSPLPSAIAMQYLPGKGLAAHKENIRFWSNKADAALNISLASTPSLTDTNGSNPIPLSVSVNGTRLTTTATSLAYATTFPGGTANGSSTMPLVIAQATPGAVASASLHVPAGFEELAQRQTVLTDVSLYGHSLGVFQSHVDLESVQFLQPEALLSAIRKTRMRLLPMNCCRPRSASLFSVMAIFHAAPVAGRRDVIS